MTSSLFDWKNFTDDSDEQLALPTLQDIAEIEAVVLDVEQLGLSAGRYRIAKADWPTILEYVNPTKKYTDSLDDAIYPIVARIEITTTDGSKLHLMIRWMGKNPLLVSKNNRIYYWGKAPPKVPDSAIALVNLVQKQGKKLEAKDK
ncbi:MAG: hypothetical protein MN733_35920 [Nitrososphaera sp.]|nr:hypothetical protein [Nitrososphaera sp.]